MLLTKNINVRITSNMVKYYRSLGYNEKCNTIINIPIEHLPKGSNLRVDVKCDMCGKVYTLQYCDYNKVEGELLCSKCKNAKTEKTNLIRYGCKNVFQNEEIRDKQRETVIEKYGCDNVFQNDAIKRKIKDTFVEKYGVDHQMKVPEIANKVQKHRAETMYRNGTCPCSKQQRYVQSVMGGGT